MDKKPVPGGIYRHFKGGLYQVIGVASHSENGEKLVIYQALYGDYHWYARPLEEFVGQVDGQKHPKYAGEYRFKKVLPIIKGNGVVEWMDAEEQQKAENSNISVLPADNLKIEISDKDSTEELEQVRPELLLFLDAKSAGDKLKVLRTLRGKIDEELLTNMELSLDLTPNEKEPMERRLQLVEATLEKRARYEGGRLR